MEALAEEHPESAGEGLRVRMATAGVYISPLSRQSALRVVGEGQSAEMAAELCDFYAKRYGSWTAPTRRNETALKYLLKK
jgi:hypothetical protein